jgi:hypothetical protein
MPCSEGDCLSIGMTHLSKRYAVGLYGFANVGLYVWGLGSCLLPCSMDRPGRSDRPAFADDST